jgi:hypothetical protein
MGFSSKNFLASFILFSCGIVNAAQLKATLITDIEFESKINTLTASAINENAEYIVFITKKELGKDFWVSEVNLFNLKTKKTKVIISASDLKGYAAYGAYASNPTWLNKSVIKIDVSDGDVGFAQVSFDLEKSTLKKGKMTDFDEWEPEQHSDISDLFKSCFANVKDSVIFSGYLEWLNKGKSAIYQARYVDVDNNLWYIDFEACNRQLILETGDSKSDDFEGWLAGFAISQDQLIFMMDKGYPTKTSNIYLAKFYDSQIQSVTSQLSFKESGKLSYLGTYKSKSLFKVKLNDRCQCSIKVLEFNASEFIEHKFEDKDICDVSLSIKNGALATVSKPIVTDERVLSLVHLNHQ